MVCTAKPDPAIFRTACRRPGLKPERVLHVGDHPVEDVEGARTAGMSGILLNRAGAPEDGASAVISNLNKLLALLGSSEDAP